MFYLGENLVGLYNMPSCAGSRKGARNSIVCQMSYVTTRFRLDEIFLRLHLHALGGVAGH